MNIFIQNKYTQWYYNIINKALNEQKEGYTESHHIIPKSLGGTNDSLNLVNLTAKEHYIVHLLLTKMTFGDSRRKMTFAFYNMSGGNNNQQRYNSNLYSFFKENNPRYHSEETKNKMSKSHMNVYHTDESKETMRQKALGRKHTIESKEKMRKAKLGRKLSNEHKEKIGNSGKGKKQTKETIEKIRLAKKNMPKIKCPHCFKIGSSPLMKRYHFDKCKLLISFS